MRICHIVEAAGGGSGQIVLDLAEAGLSAGDDITVIYAPARAEAHFVKKLSVIPRLRSIAVPMQRAVGFHDVLALRQLYYTLRQTGPFDIIHSHSSKAGALARLAGLILPSHQIYTPYAFVTMSSDASRFYRWIEWLLSLMCDRIIVVSEREWQHARQLGISTKKLVLIPNAMDMSPGLTRQEARHKLGMAEDEYSCVFVGRLTAQKNPLRALDAFAQALSKQPSMQLYIIGDGPLMPQIQTMIEMKSLKNHVRLLGYLNSRNVMAAFDGLLCSSDYESLPIIFLEALLAGVPIITTPVGGIDEAVIEGETGIISRDFSVSSLADALIKLGALDLAQLNYMKTTAMMRAKNFTIPLMAERVQNLYTALVVSRGSLPQMKSTS